MTRILPPLFLQTANSRITARANPARRCVRTGGETATALVQPLYGAREHMHTLQRYLCVGPGSENCASRCGVYVENGPPVPVLSGAGLYVEDEDHNEIFLMTEAEVTLVTRDTSDFQDVLLNATYLYHGVEQTYSDGSESNRKPNLKK